MEYISGYTILETIEENDLWGIHRARKHRRSGPAVLLQMFSEDLFDTRVMQEARYNLGMLQNIDSGQLIKIYDIIDENGRLTIVCEDYQGKPLSELLKKRKIKTEETLRITLGIVDALGILHDSAIIHASISPHTILVDPDTLSVKLMPFIGSRDFIWTNKLMQHPNIIERILPYISPEQTGKTGREVDARSDRYSLGIVLYQMLTGITPFQSEDPLEIVYAHAIRVPVPPVELKSDIPPVLSDLAMKLIQKDPENRYQSTGGLKADIEKCISLTKSDSPLSTIVLGDNDIPQLFTISKKLYGRIKETGIIHNALKGVRDGSSEIINVIGPSGIGKTTFVTKIIRPLAGIKGLFITGKCDQLKMEMPYSPMIEAFRGLVRQILTESDEVVEIWKESILDSVGQNARIIIDVIPEVELITGPQPPVPELGAEETKNRFNLVFTNFIRVFISSKRPLTIFIDDLQWVDAATVTLFKYIITDPKIKYLFIVGAYRDNEIGEYHSLRAFRDDLEKAGIRINMIKLQPLDVIEVAELITDTLKCRDDRAWQLAALAYQHTSGNPLFVTQFLKSLNDEKLLRRDPATGWTWDIETIRRMYKMDTVVTVMANRIKSLPKSALETLKYASCIGNTFDLDILSGILGRPAEDVATDLRTVIDDGYVVASALHYRFSHDRFYETAYSLIPEQNRHRIHTAIGNALMAKAGEHNFAEKIFDIVNQLNMGSTLITEPAEKLALAELNLKAGMRAKLSVAYESAVKYFRRGAALLDANSWEPDYIFTLSLHRELFECEYLVGNREEADTIFALYVKHAKTRIEKAQIYDLKVTLLMNSSMPREAIEVGLEGLDLLGIRLIKEPSRARILSSLFILKFKLTRHGVESILRLPDMKDETQITAMSLFMNLWMPAYSCNLNLMQFLPILMVNTSLKYGNCNISSLGYATFGMLLGYGMGDFESGYRLGALSKELNEKYMNTGFNCTLNFMMGAFLIHWKEHARNDIEYLVRAYRCGIATGDLYYSRLTGIMHAGAMMMKGDNLNNVLTVAFEYLDYTTKGKNIHVSNALTVVIRCALQLQGKTKSGVNLGDENFDEEKFLSELETSEVIQPLHWYCLFKSRNLYLLGHYDEALDLITHYEKTREWHFSSLVLPEHNFIHSLILAARCDSAQGKEKSVYIKKLRHNQKIMKKWSKSAPENFMHKYLLVEAEISRIRGKDTRAMKFYNEAIASALANDYVQNSAMANELAAKFCISREFNDYAKSHLEAAVRGYAAWGATLKVEMLQQKYAGIIAEDAIPADWAGAAAHGAAAPSEKTNTISLSTLIRELREMSSESNTTSVIKRAIVLACAMSGATRALLLLARDSKLWIEAECAAPDTVIMTTGKEANDTDGRLAASIIHHVQKNLQPVFFNRGDSGDDFSADPYIEKTAVPAIACVPMVDRGELAGMMYLEYPSFGTTFTAETMEILNLIATQTTLSIGNSSRDGGDGRKGQYSRTLLKGVNTELIYRRLMELMEKEKIFKTEDLSLMIMAEELSLTPQQLSEFLNDRLNMNFNTFINKYRIEEAKQILRNEPDRPITSIAYDLGFNTISVFYSAFCKFTGVSPARFRKEGREQMADE